jgi:hypothetical protein
LGVEETRALFRDNFWFSFVALKWWTKLNLGSVTQGKREQSETLHFSPILISNLLHDVCEIVSFTQL